MGATPRTGEKAIGKAHDVRTLSVLQSIMSEWRLGATGAEGGTVVMPVLENHSGGAM